MENKKNLPIKVFDFFSGCGGTSKGFQNAGLEIVFALDNDKDSSITFKNNFPNTHFELTDIKELDLGILVDLVNTNRESPLLFSGCAPCQPFTKQKTNRSQPEEQKFLLREFEKIVLKFLPEYVFVENVPGLQKVKENGPFFEFVNSLEENGYKTEFSVISSMDYGVPQRRRRLVFIASRLGEIKFPNHTHGNASGKKYSTVRDWIAEYPEIDAGETHKEVPNHRSAFLSEKNLLRMKATLPGGSRKDWPEELKLTCHSGEYNGHTDVYGRMKWDEPASGLTTRCISLSNGRFGHPEQNRAISVREAAAIQTFPDDFIFFGNLNSMARQIGNAVPVLLAKNFGLNFVHHYKNYLNEKGE